MTGSFAGTTDPAAQRKMTTKNDLMAGGPTALLRKGEAKSEFFRAPYPAIAPSSAQRS
jgi:hypothetical protein